MTYRWREHVGPDYDYNLGYRSKQELEEWLEKCPIKRVSEVVSQREEKMLIEGFSKEIDEAIDYARQSPFPKPS
jgi:TPP-dependent pyruvate/acetoin dehydrogenase alpha subunit